ncbi:hypothetical protein [Fodinibius sp.]|uniref:hypothetical protein n=1 Tax=Fodinibius sp. TaxID=1872440 RepID=UPI002ACE591B|nr:hypothetical protein [Fodinibius sp.]MDZ7658077.1 hypothetical protein [Fodinibius sp.]
MFSSIYNDHLYVPGSSTGGSQDDDGDWNPGSSGEPKYDGKCNAQEPGTGGGLKITTSDTEVSTETADLWVFLKDKAKAKVLSVDDRGTLTYKGQEFEVVIKNRRLIDGLIEVNTI